MVSRLVAGYVEQSCGRCEGGEGDECMVTVVSLGKSVEGSQIQAEHGAQLRSV